MSEFKKYRKTQIAEMRYVERDDINDFLQLGKLEGISISQPDLDNGSPKIGDMIARNPKNHADKWLVAEKYFNDNFEPLDNE